MAPSSFALKRVQYKGQYVDVPIPEYPYQRCYPDWGDIRLVKIHPSQRRESHLVCSLVGHSLNSAPPYVALSYECGDPSQYRFVDVDGIDFPVTQSLYAGLRELRAKHCEYVWCDAICIHQSDEDEKNIAVRSLASIYKRADAVVAWVGQAERGSDWVMDTLSTYARTSTRNLSKRFSKQELKNFIAFFERSYWRRAWITQEIALGRKVSISCGSKAVNWVGLSAMIAEMTQNDIFLDNFQSFQHIQRLCRDRIRLNQPDLRPMGLLETLHDTSAALSTDPRDKVYAVMGLASDSQDYLKKPRYEESWTEQRLCLEMTINFINSTQSLDIIFAGKKDININMFPRLPSWCPNYVQFPPHQVLKSLARYISGNYIRHRYGRECRKWNTLGQAPLPPNSTELRGSQVLIASGYFIDYIDEIGLVWNEHEERRPTAQRNPNSGSRIERSRSRSMHRQSSSSLRDIYRTGKRALGIDEHPAKTKRLLASVCKAMMIYDPDYREIGSNQALLDLLYKFDSRVFRRDGLLGLGRRRIDILKCWRENNADMMIDGVRLREIARAYSAKKEAEKSYDGLREYRRHSSQSTDQLGDLLLSTELSGNEDLSDISDSFYTRSASVSRSSSSRSKRRRRLEARRAASGVLWDSLASFCDLVEEGLRLMTLEDGRIGWAHPDARTGDSIYLLAGCSMPVILRRSQHTYGTYKVIGHAYVDGVMNNELWPMVSRYDRKEVLLS